MNKERWTTCSYVSKWLSGWDACCMGLTFVLEESL